MSKFVLNVRHRPELHESISERFRKFREVLAELPAPWGTARGVEMELPAAGSALSSRIKLRGKLGRKISGELKLQLRAVGNLSDRAADDDALLLEFDSKDVDWKTLVDVALPSYLVALDAYSARLDRWEELSKKFEIWSKACRDSGKDLDGRDGPMQFGAINFLDRELCERMAKGLTPSRVVEALSADECDARVFADGVLVSATDDFPGQDQVAEFDHRIRDRLNLPLWI